MRKVSNLNYMKNRDYTLEDEKNTLERFLRNQNIQPYYNYLRMEKGPRPFFYTAISLSYQLRFSIFQFYYLVFTKNCIYLLTQDKEFNFNANNMTKINYDAIHNFSHERKLGAYCLSFTHLNEDYYFYLNDRFSSRVLSKLFNTETMNYSRYNLSYLESTNFMGLLKN